MPQTTRRYRTAKKIQATAVQLAVRDGLANVTTEAIAREAGISTRTFFNYYPYKEAAMMGPPPDYPAEASEQFVNGGGTLIEDLNRLITAHLSRFLDEREMLVQILALSDTDPKLDALRNSTVLSRRAQMRDLLRRRCPDAKPAQIEILAAAIVAATNAATKEWTSGEADDFIVAARENLSLIQSAAEMLGRRPC
ncbi:TetR/AcrR family transcriptional regulator [Paracoccus benzoatiresistens]|uniref:TetR/AcrR family transcriptional regulator n=1 Tax=Paracoccus benzoatiresistens TaxID=2997341 RepID=A0ABT4J3Q2_9RHOB|nr:TetR/AcrR family transcriptional regulator [Paracoccus sp. EF6]MCZ0961723.1 TetR/AcrR family transcriptional regulator [Paracoccus sp. EF6]